MPAPPPKVDYVADLLNILSVKTLSESGSESSSKNDNAWAEFQTAPATTAADRNITTKPVEKKDSLHQELKTYLKDSPPVMLSSAPVKPQGNVKNNIMNLFNEPFNMVSPYSIHQQQLAFLSQQQGLVMAAAKAGDEPTTFPGRTNQLAVNGSLANGNFPMQNWPKINYQIPGMTPPSGRFC